MVGPPVVVVPVHPELDANSLLQIGMILYSNELAQLWAQDNALTAEKVFVWSQYKNAWVSLLAVPEICQAIAKARLNNPNSWAPQPIIVSRSIPAAPSDAPPISAERRPTSSPAITGAFEALVARGRSLVRPLRAKLGQSILTAFVSLALFAIFLPAKVRSNTAASNSDINFSRVQPNGAPVPHNRQSFPVSIRRGDSSMLTAQAQVVPIESLPLIDAPKSKISRVHTYASEPPRRRHAMVTSQRTTLQSRERPFDANVARDALEMASWRARGCTRTEVSGRVAADFEPSGAVAGVSISSLAGDFTGKDCLVSAFRTARVSPFSGGRMLVSKSFRVKAAGG